VLRFVSLLSAALIPFSIPFDKQTLRWNDRVLIDPMYNRVRLCLQPCSAFFATVFGFVCNHDRHYLQPAETLTLPLPTLLRRSLVDFGIANGSTCMLHVSTSE
jgi:hypothetical protein